VEEGSSLGDVSLEVHGDADDRHFRLIGELDLATADEFIERIRPVVARGSDINLDLSGLTFIDSSGIRALIVIATELDGVGSLVLSSPQDEVARVLELVGAHRLPGVKILQQQDESS